jgi:hypothetical protein
MRISPAIGARATPPEVDHPGVPPVRFADRPPQSLGRMRNRNQVHVIGHETVSPDLNLLGLAELGHQLQVGCVILVAKERLLPAVTPLRDMMRQTGSYDAS